MWILNAGVVAVAPVGLATVVAMAGVATAAVRTTFRCEPGTLSIGPATTGLRATCDRAAAAEGAAFAAGDTARRTALAVAFMAVWAGTLMPAAPVAVLPETPLPEFAEPLLEPGAALLPAPVGVLALAAPERSLPDPFDPSVSELVLGVGAAVGVNTLAPAATVSVTQSDLRDPLVWRLAVPFECSLSSWSCSSSSIGVSALDLMSLRRSPAQSGPLIRLIPIHPPRRPT